MKKKEDKNKDLASLRQDLGDLKNLFVTGYEKTKVSQDFELRKVVRGAGGKYRVVKNNLAELAGEGTPSRAGAERPAGHDVAGLHHRRSGGAGQGADGVREDQPLHLPSRPAWWKAGSIDVKAINDLALMPSKEVIFAKLLYVINAPAQQLVTAMNAVGRNLAVVVDQGVKENKFSE